MNKNYDSSVLNSVSTALHYEFVAKFKDAFYHYNETHGFCWDKSFDLEKHKLLVLRRDFEIEIEKLCGTKNVFSNKAILRDGQYLESLWWAYSVTMLVLLRSVYNEIFLGGIDSNVKEDFLEFIDARYFQIISGKTHVVTAISIFLFEKMNERLVL